MKTRWRDSGNEAKITRSVSDKGSLRLDGLPAPGEIVVELLGGEFVLRTNAGTSSGSAADTSSDRRYFVTFVFVDSAGAPLAERPFRATFSDGSQQEGTLDKDGQATLTSIPTGDVQIELADDPDAALELGNEALG